MTGNTIGARIRAARALGGFQSVPALAMAMGLRGAGRTKLYAAERDEHVLPYPTMREIADCCANSD